MKSVIRENKNVVILNATDSVNVVKEYLTNIIVLEVTEEEIKSIA